MIKGYFILDAPDIYNEGVLRHRLLNESLSNNWSEIRQNSTGTKYLFSVNIENGIPDVFKDYELLTAEQVKQKISDGNF